LSPSRSSLTPFFLLGFSSGQYVFSIIDVGSVFTARIVFYSFSFPNQSHIYLAEIRNYEDTRPRSHLEATISTACSVNTLPADFRACRGKDCQRHSVMASSDSGLKTKLCEYAFSCLACSAVCKGNIFVSCHARAAQLQLMPEILALTKGKGKNYETK